MDNKTPKVKKAPTQKQIELKQKKEEIRKILKEHGVTFRLGMNAKGVKGYDEGLRGKKLVKYILEKVSAPSNTVKPKTVKKAKTSFNNYFNKTMKNLNVLLAKAKSQRNTKTAKTFKTVKKGISNVRNAMGYQQRANTMRNNYMKNTKKGMFKKYNYTVRNAKNAEIADLKAEVAHLKRVCLSKKAFAESKRNMPSPPPRNMSAFRRLFEENNE